MKILHPKFLRAVRWVHVYLTVLAALGLGFFAVTGLILNHKDAFGLAQAKTETRTATLSGLILWIALPRRRRCGMVGLAVGSAAFVAAYFLLVP